MNERRVTDRIRISCCSTPRKSRRETEKEKMRGRIESGHCSSSLSILVPRRSSHRKVKRSFVAHCPSIPNFRANSSSSQFDHRQTETETERILLVSTITRNFLSGKKQAFSPSLPSLPPLPPSYSPDLRLLEPKPGHDDDEREALTATLRDS